MATMFVRLFEPSPETPIGLGVLVELWEMMVRVRVVPEKYLGPWCLATLQYLLIKTGQRNGGNPLELKPMSDVDDISIAVRLIR